MIALSLVYQLCEFQVSRTTGLYVPTQHLKVYQIIEFFNFLMGI